MEERSGLGEAFLGFALMPRGLRLILDEIEIPWSIRIFNFFDVMIARVLRGSFRHSKRKCEFLKVLSSWKCF